MRKIILGDVFKMAKIIKISNAKDEIKEIFEKISTAKEEGENVNSIQKEVGIEFIAYIIDACGEDKVEKALYELIAGIAEKKADEIKNQSIEATIEMIKQIAKENDLKNFLSLAVKSA